MKKHKGIKSLLFIMAFVVGYVIVIFTLVVQESKIRSINEEITQSTQKFIQFIQTGDLLKSGSDKLTERVRMFVETGNITYMDEYFKEVDEVQSRQRALSIMNEADVTPSTKAYLESAKRRSDSLSYDESRAMKLICEAYQIDEALIPEVVKEVNLSRIEKEMSPSEKIEQAKKIVYGNDYLEVKYKIILDIEYFTTKGSTELTSQYYALKEDMDQLLKTQQIMMFVLITVVILFVVLFIGMLLPALLSATKKIGQGEKIESNFPIMELNLLADTYNQLLEDRSSFEGLLHLQAETDALTNMGNRSALVRYLATMTSRDRNKPFSVISMDLNGLKTVNDRFGHSKGDELLIKASQCITESFKHIPNCRLFRMGGDEFAAYIEDIYEDEIKEAIREFRHNQKKQDVSIAVGYAYCENTLNKSVEDLYIMADKRMYEEKRMSKRRQNDK